MSWFRSTLLNIRYPYVNPIDRQRAITLLLIAWIAMAGVVGSFLFIVPVVFRGGLGVNGIAASALAIVLFGGIVFLLQTGRVRVASLILITGLLLSTLVSINDGISGIRAATLITPAITAALLLSWRETALVLVIVVALITQVVIGEAPVIVNGSDQRFINAFVLALLIIVNTSFLLLFNGATQRVTARFLEQIERLRRIGSQVSLMGGKSDTRSIINATIDIIREDLGYPFARFYRIDNVSTLVTRLSADTYGDVEVKSVEIEGSNAIAEAARRREVVVVTETSFDIRKQHLLPGLRIGAAIPVVDEGRLIGVLDVQSDQTEQLNEAELSLLVSLAKQLGSSIAQAERLNTLTGDLQAQQAVINRLRERLQEFESRDQQSVIRNWSSYLTQRGTGVIGYDLNMETGEVTLANHLPEPLMEAMQGSQLTTTQGPDHVLVNVPIRLRDQVIGALSFRLPPGQNISRFQAELIENVVDRLALALENKRLFEQSQSQARRESIASEIGGLLLTSTDVQSVLKLAADQFNQAIGAIQTQIVLRPESRPTPETDRS